MKILVLLASFLDDELPYTIQSCIDNAAHPENIRFAVFLQHNEQLENIIDHLPYDILIKKIDYKESRGVGWARNIVNQMHTDEEYVLQIDSHSRLTKNWDTIMVDELNQLGNRSIISYLMPSYIKDKKNNIDLNFLYKDTPTIIHVPKPINFVGDWAVHVGEYKNMQDTKMKNICVPFLFAGFIFARAQWLKDVPSDPDMYYWGEEMSLGIRSWTRGYDIYLPKQVVAWHYGSTIGAAAAPHHWDVIDEKIASPMHHRAMSKLDKIMRGDITGMYGLGTERTLEQWMEFSGVDYANKKFNERNFHDQ